VILRFFGFIIFTRDWYCRHRDRPSMLMTHVSSRTSLLSRTGGLTLTAEDAAVRLPPDVSIY